MTMTTEYVSKEDFDALCAAMDKRRAAVVAAEQALAEAQTLAEKIVAKAELKAARAMPVAQ
jgi:hypothetical protein